MTIRIIQQWNGYAPDQIVSGLGSTEEARLIALGFASADLDGPDGGGEIAKFATDASSRVTGLVDPVTGLTHATLGTSVITVGAGGMYSTIQSAIDYLETLTQFEAVSGVGSSPTVTAWTQHSDELTVTGLAGATNLGREGYWFTHASLSGRLYPCEATLGLLGTKLISRMRRIEATFSGSEALSFYRPIVRTIMLLPGANYDEDITFSVPVCVRLLGDGVAKHEGTISFTTGVTHGIFIAEGLNLSLIHI